MAIHPPLLLLATALGVASRGEAAPPAAQWVVLPAGSPAGQAASHGEFGPFTLATTPASAALPAAAAAAAGVSRWQHEPASRVWVVRLGQHVVDGGNLRDALTDAQAALTLRHEGRAGWLVVEATADLPVGKGIDAAVPRSWRPLLESLSVPPTPVRPAASRDGPPSSVARWLAPGILKALPVRRGNRSGHAAATPRVAADPGIVAALAEVQEENLRTTVEHLADNYHTRLSTSEGARGAEEWIKREFTRMGLEVHEFEFNSSMSKVVTATRAGTVDPSRLVVIGAHYDSRAADMEEDERAPGADDNGSGTAMVLELARVAAALRMDTAYSLHFCAFSGEEQGLLGSRAYANHLAEKYGPNKVVAMFNGDMLGWTLPGTPISLGMKDRFVSEWLLSVADLITEVYVPQLTVARSASCCSDHQSFTEAGFPAIGYFENAGGASDYPHYHSETDLPEYLNYKQVTLIARSMLAAGLTLAAPVKSGV